MKFEDLTPDRLEPIVMPELEAGDQTARVSAWLAELEEDVIAGDAVVEVLVKGITFDVEAPASGTLRRIHRFEQDAVEVGDVLGWIEPR